MFWDVSVLQALLREPELFRLITNMGFSRLLFGAGLLVESVRGGTSSLSIPETRPRAAAALDPAPVAVS